MKADKRKTWIGVDLDGTLAEYHGAENTFRVGPPVPAMVRRVKRWLKQGREVRVFTARVDGGTIAQSVYRDVPDETVEVYRQLVLVVKMIQDWTERHCGARLKVTCVKDAAMEQLWDDRCVQVRRNTGRRVGGPGGARNKNRSEI